MKIKLKPFTVPNFVIPKGSVSDGYPLKMLEPQEISDMCDEFRESVFRKAGKRDPNRLVSSQDTNA